VVDEPHVVSVQATGKPLGAVLDEIVAADRRYEWRDENGVIVLRPAAAWTDGSNPLHRNLDAIRFADVGVTDVLSLMVAMFGQELDASQRTAIGDARRFDLDLPPGTVLDALNGIVRAHGKLSWAVEPVRAKGPLAPGTTLSPFMVWVGTDSGNAQGIGIRLDREPRLPEQLVRTGRPRPASAVPPLDRLVGRKYNHAPVVVSSMYQLPELAYAAQAAMGIEVLPAGEVPAALTKGITLTGLTLRNALDALVAADPRYEWRDIDGVIVLRPASAWNETEHPLLRRIGPVHLDGVSLNDAITFQHALLEPQLRHGPDPSPNNAPRITVDLQGGTHLTLVNAIVKSQGAACWMYEELNARDAAFFGGRSHQLTVALQGGGGQGFAFR
jgi:hypothetical protein